MYDSLTYVNIVLAYTDKTLTLLELTGREPSFGAEGLRRSYKRALETFSFVIELFCTELIEKGLIVC